MKTVAIAAAKGGVCKTTLTTMLAVRATQESLKVGMLDLNEDQGNLTHWWAVRDEPFNPMLIREYESLPRAIRKMDADGYDWCFIDTPPLDMDVIETCVMVADAVLIPVRTSFFDVVAADAVVEMCREHRKPFAFVLTAVDSRFKSLVAQAVKSLSAEGEIFATRISYRVQYIKAVTHGKTGAEIAPKELSAEIDALWNETMRLVGRDKVVPLRRRNPSGQVLQ